MHVSHCTNNSTLSGQGGGAHHSGQGGGRQGAQLLGDASRQRGRSAAELPHAGVQVRRGDSVGGLQQVCDEYSRPECQQSEQHTTSFAHQSPTAMAPHAPPW
jgi:hypothetical protein